MKANSLDSSPPKKPWFDRFVRIFDSTPSDVSALQEMLYRAVDKGVLDLQVLPILEGALSVADMQAREIMVPLSQTVSMTIGLSTDDILQLAIDSGHSRFPVVGDSTDDVRGILHAKDLLPLALSSENRAFHVKDSIRQATTIPESMRLDDLLQEFRTTRNHMAIVIDEYGSVSGIVTIEDVLEQIVGEIADEHDIDDEVFITKLDQNTYTVKARTTISDFNDCFDTEFSSAEYETIGGIILHHCGHMPKRDEVMELAGLRIVVLGATPRRLRLLQVTRLPSVEDAAQPTDAKP